MHWLYRPYKSKIYKRISESSSYVFIESDEKWDDIVENPFEDDIHEVKDDFSARSRARAEGLWSELGDETRQSLIDENLTATDYYSVVTRGEYATDNAVRAGFMLSSKNNGDNNIRNINVLTDTMAYALQQIK